MVCEDHELSTVTPVVTSIPWQSLGDTTVKGETMSMTQENFYRIIGMHEELIMEQKQEISDLKMKINKLNQKLTKG